MEIERTFNTYNLKNCEIKSSASTYKFYIPNINAATGIQKTSSSYWMKIWPSSVALADFINKHHQIFKNKNIVELGAGIGLPSMAAARYAHSITCSDIEADAVELMKLNFKDYPSISAAQINWNHLPDNISADIWMMSDVNYDSSNFESLEKLFENILHKKSKIILSTPHRLAGRSFINHIIHRCSLKEDFEIEENEKITTVSVFMLE